MVGVVDCGNSYDTPKSLKCRNVMIELAEEFGNVKGEPKKVERVNGMSRALGDYMSSIFHT